MPYRVITVCLVVFCAAMQVRAQDNLSAYKASPVSENGSYGIHGSDLLWKQEAAIRQYVAAHPEANLKTRLSKQGAWGFVVGSVKSWYATDLSTGTTEYLVPSTCRAVGTNCYVFVEDAQWGTRVTQSVVDSVRAVFDLRTPANANKGIYQTDVDAFGNPPDVDGDPRIVILILDIKDGYTGTGGFVEGYFYSLNEIDRPTSNKAEIYYLDANPLDLTKASGLQGGLSTTAHEFQHMIHYNYDTNEITFVNEGCSLVAEVNAGYPLYAQSGFVNETNHSLFDWRRGDNTAVLKDYSRAARFMTYVRDQFGIGIFKTLVGSTLTGSDGVTYAMQKAGASWTFADLVQNFAIANIVNDRTIDTKYGYLYPSILKASGPTFMNPSYTTSGTPDVVEPYGALYLAFKAGSDLKALFTAEPGLVIKAIEVGAGSQRIVDIASGTQFAEPLFGTTYTEIYFVILNRDALQHTVASAITGKGVSSVELKYDILEPSGYLALSPNDTVAVTFDGTKGAKLDSVRVALRRAGTITGGVWSMASTRRPLGTPLAVPVTATTAAASPVPYPVPYENWGTIDLRSKNIDASNAFVVTFNILGDPLVDQRVMVSKYPGTAGYHSYTYLNAPSSGAPDWYYLSANADSIYVYHVRAYVSFNVTPGISSFTPSAGRVGTVVTVSGAGFGAAQGSSIFKFGTVTAAPSSWSDTQILVPVPAGAAGSVTLSATVNGVTYNSPAQFTVDTSTVPVISLPATLAFGIVTAGTSLQKTLAIGNTGYTTLTGTLSIPSNSGFTLGGASLSVAAGATQNVAVIFSPLAAQTYNTSITVTHNAAGSPSTVAVSGSGQPQGTPATITVSPVSVLIMKNGTTGTFTPATINVANFGEQTLSAAVSYSGTSFISLASASAFTVTGGASALITLGQTSSRTLETGTYTGMVTITHNAAGGTTSIPVELRIVALPTSFDVTKTIAFPTPDNAAGYQLIGIPGAGTRGPSSVLTGTYKTDWRLYRDNGAAANYLVEYDGSSVFNFTAGRGFWILSRKGLSVSGNASSVTSLTGAYVVTLQSGWNIIANPYERTVLWTDVKKYNALSANSVIYEWNNGVWAQTSSMVPFKAYYYNNIAGAAGISIPYDPAGSLSKTADDAGSMPYVSDRAVHVTLSSYGRDVASVYAGFDSTSCTDYDANDYFAPPPAFSTASMAIENDAPHMPAARLSVDHRKEVGDGQIFDLLIQNKTADVAYVRANGMQTLPNEEVYLQNAQSHLSFDLRQSQQVPVPPGSEEMHYQLVIGSKAYMQKHGIALAPTDFTLNQNYPNPFNPSTTIGYGLPAASRVSIKIYNTLGQQIADLVSAEQGAGWHEIVWKAKVASGLYFYRLEAVGLNTPNTRFAEVRKMLLVK